MRKDPTDNYINFALLGNNIYDMNSIQIKLNNCVKVFESDEYKELASKQTVELRDVYKLGKFYQNNILNF